MEDDGGAFQVPRPIRESMVTLPGGRSLGYAEYGDPDGREIHVPVRFWHGDADGIVPLSHGEFMATIVPGAELVVVPGGGHFAGYILGRDVLDWVAQVWMDREHARPMRVVRTEPAE